ncbi:hypothetical protein BVIET440_20015 [Burkholderia vietnamiensis]
MVIPVFRLLEPFQQILEKNLGYDRIHILSLFFRLYPWLD